MSSQTIRYIACSLIGVATNSSSRWECCYFGSAREFVETRILGCFLKNDEFGLEYLPKFRVLNVDEQTTTSYAAVRGELKRAGTPIPSNDVWIAALCRQYPLPVLSRDRHFDLVPGLRRIGW